jgi:spermidine synthase
MPQERFFRFLLGISMFLMGMCGICYEYVLGALGNYLMGSSHEQIFVIIGLMMFAMGLGALFQKILEENLLEKFLVLEIFLGGIGGVSATLVYLAHGYTRLGLPLLWIFAFTIGLLIGLEIPLLIRVNKKYASSLKENLSFILSLDYVGSLAGALLFTYLLLRYFSLTQISLILGLLNTCIGLGSFFFFRKEVQHPKRVLALAFGILFLLSSFLIFSKPLNQKVEQQFYRDPIIFSKTSKYQHITLTQYQDQIALYINGHLQFSSIDEYLYHELLVHPAMIIPKSPQQVLILGGGDGLALREVLKYPEVQSVTLVDLDPEITQLSASHPAIVALNQGALLHAKVQYFEGTTRVPESPEKSETQKVEVLNQNRLNPWDIQKQSVAAVQLFHLDADIFLKKIQDQRYDIILLDFPDPQSIEVAKLYSVEFYHQVLSLLKPNGVVAVQAGSPYFMPKAFASIGKTLNQAGFTCFPYHTYIPTLGEWGFYLAWEGKQHPSGFLEKLFHTEIPVETRYLNVPALKASFSFGKNILLDPHQVESNTALAPVLPRYYREDWR